MRSLKSAEVLLAVGIVVCFALLGLLDYRRQLHEAEQFATFSSYDFQHGGYHAWYDLLRREGIHVARQERRPAYLNGSVATLIVANNTFDSVMRARVGQPIGTYVDADKARLRAWVEGGGRLVWLVDQPSASPAEKSPKKTLRKLTGRTDDSSSLHVPVVLALGSMKDRAAPIVPSSLTDGVNALSGSSNLRIPFDADPAVTPLIADGKGAVVAQYRLGKGSVVVITDESLFQNSNLSKADNARLAYNLAALNLRAGETVAFDEWTHGYQSGDTWWAITPWTLRLALSIAGGALLLLLLGATWRFGPAARLPENTERTSEDYLLSMAALLGRGQAARKAVHDLAQIALHAAARSAGMPDSSPAASIATRLRGSEAGDRRAHDLITLERLAGYQHPTALELLQAARLSRTLRKELTFDGSHVVRPRRAPSRRSA